MTRYRYRGVVLPCIVMIRRLIYPSVGHVHLLYEWLLYPGRSRDPGIRD